MIWKSYHTRESRAEIKARIWDGGESEVSHLDRDLMCGSVQEFVRWIVYRVCPGRTVVAASFPLGNYLVNCYTWQLGDQATTIVRTRVDIQVRCTFHSYKHCTPVHWEHTKKWFPETEDELGGSTDFEKYCIGLLPARDTGTCILVQWEIIALFYFFFCFFVPVLGSCLIPFYRFFIFGARFTKHFLEICMAVL